MVVSKAIADSPILFWGDIGCVPERLRRWVRQAERDGVGALG